jgi:fatty-acyl-CoA synthase
MLAQVTVDYMAPSTFAVRPRIWLELISRYRGTISFSPTFGYELCVRRSAKGGTGFDLSSWRVAGVGGEMVRPEVLRQFASLFADSGFDARAFVPSYGLAEATLAVSFTPLGVGLSIDTVDRELYESTGRAVSAAADGAGRKVRSFAKCGRPLPGYAIEIRDDTGTVLPERSIGGVVINGPSLMRGYFDDPDRTRAVLGEDGWLDTGDMGYLVDGSLVVTGRRKDLIICNGRNIWPQDLEWAVECLPDVRSGSVAAFSVDDETVDDERVVLVVECQLGDPVARRHLDEEVRASVYRSAGVSCDVVLVAPRSLPFTSSGKLSRAASKAQYLTGSLKPLAIGATQ